MEKLTIREIAGALGVPYEQDGNITSLCTDSREVVPGSLFVAIHGENLNGHRFIGSALEKGAACVLSQEPAEHSNHRILVVKDTLKALLDLSAWYRDQFPVRVVGITGSVGKTTTKDMIAAVAQAKYNTVKTQGNQNNEIGLPKTLLNIDNTTQVAIVEMGMSAFGEIEALAKAARPEMGVITNIGVSHLEHLGSRENILKAKLELAQNLPDGAPLFLCRDNDLLAEVKIPRLQVIFYSLADKSCPLCGTITKVSPIETRFIIHWEGKDYPAKIPGFGNHLVLNALAAFGVGQKLGIPPEDCVSALKNYTPSAMRQKVVEHRGVTVVEDCYNASPDSMAAAINAFQDYRCSGRKILILSDMLELGEIARDSHRQVGALAAHAGIDRLIAWGDLAKEYVEGAKEQGMENARFYEKKDEAAAALVEETKEGDLLWFRGSRGMKLEEIIAYFYQHYTTLNDSK